MTQQVGNEMLVKTYLFLLIFFLKLSETQAGHIEAVISGQENSGPQPKTVMGFYQEAVDLSEFPTPPARFTHAPSTEVTLGDLHGNALKLLYFLIKEGVIDMSSEDYFEFGSLYIDEDFSNPIDPKTKTTPPSFLPLSQQTITQLKSILRRITVLPNRPKIRLIGDVLCDRGANDYLTLKLIEKIAQEKVPLEIILSNHDLDFIRFFFLLPYPPGMMPTDKLSQHFQALVKSVWPNVSLVRFLKAAEVNPELWTEAADIFGRYYLPSLKLFSISFRTDRGEIAYFSHAWTGLEAIEMLAQTYGIAGCDLAKISTNPITLFRCEQAINSQFKKEFFEPPFPNGFMRRIETQLQTVRNYTKPSTGHTQGIIWDLSQFSIYYLIWNRGPEFSLEDGHFMEPFQPIQLDGYAMFYIFGHVGEDSGLSSSAHLDTNLGKTQDFYEGTYRVHRF